MLEREVSHGRGGLIEGAVFPSSEPITEEQMFMSQISGLSCLDEIRRCLNLTYDDIKLYKSLEEKLQEKRNGGLTKDELAAYIFLGARCRVYECAELSFKLRDSIIH